MLMGTIDMRNPIFCPEWIRTVIDYYEIIGVSGTNLEGHLSHCIQKQLIEKGFITRNGKRVGTGTDAKTTD